MQDLALSRGLRSSANMTKTRTEVLVVAQRGTQSGKAKKAAQWEKPVLSAEEFLEWAEAAQGIVAVTLQENMEKTG